MYARVDWVVRRRASSGRVGVVGVASDGGGGDTRRRRRGGGAQNALAAAAACAADPGERLGCEWGAQRRYDSGRPHRPPPLTSGREGGGWGGGCGQEGTRMGVSPPTGAGGGAAVGLWAIWRGAHSPRDPTVCKVAGDDDWGGAGREPGCTPLPKATIPPPNRRVLVVWCGPRRTQLSPPTGKRTQDPLGSVETRFLSLMESTCVDKCTCACFHRLWPTTLYFLLLTDF